MMTSNQLRQLFLEFFANKNHTIVPSSPLIPANDPSLLFTNAGMVQFKDVFLGLEKRPYQRAASAQKCVRAGGKHNDLENVGYTARHHTFFEMLGNFSFGDYFKAQAISMAWEFITQVLKIPPEKLWVTVYKEDQEAEDIWLKQIKIDPARFSRCGQSDNFWSMGDTGPCGPCTEIFYDHGPHVPGGPPGSPEADGDRYIEIWNLVFMQYNRDAQGNFTSLPKPSVDTGMGFERVCAVMQGVHNNYDTDLFKPLVDEIAAMGGIPDKKHASLRVIADHIRSCAFLICDGIVPSNEGRGYVLRRIIRRAIRHGHKLGFRDPFFYRLSKPLARQMGDAYPELQSKLADIEYILKQEEQQFAKTLDHGLKIFEQEVAHLQQSEIPGDVIFRLYDTYGFPVDLTADIARERRLTLDYVGFEKAMEAARRLSQRASKFSDVAMQLVDLGDHIKTKFVGYETTQIEAVVLGVLNAEYKLTQTLTPGLGAVILNQTPFYAESGGQVSDTGVLVFPNGRFHVENSRKEGDVMIHLGRLEGTDLPTGARVMAKVDVNHRINTANNHSATHLLHAALREVLGKNSQQRGSLVSPDRLRFDYAALEAPTSDQLQRIEHLVNRYIRANVPIETEVLSIDEAMKKGADALFGEKYGEKVRVLHMGEFSLELCGGTHAKRTGDIGFFKIISESSISAGVRRIEAMTGDVALNYVDELEQKLNQSLPLLKASKENVVEKIAQLADKNKQLEKELERLHTKLLTAQCQAIQEEVQSIHDKSLLVYPMGRMDIKSLRFMAEFFKSKYPHAVIVLAAEWEGKAHVMSVVTGSCQISLAANILLQPLIAEIQAKGGGKKDFAQAGGGDISRLPLALNKLKKSLVTSLGSLS